MPSPIHMHSKKSLYCAFPTKLLVYGWLAGCVPACLPAETPRHQDTTAGYSQKRGCDANKLLAFRTVSHVPLSLKLSDGRLDDMLPLTTYFVELKEGSHDWNIGIVRAKCPRELSRKQEHGYILQTRNIPKVAPPSIHPLPFHRDYLTSGYDDKALGPESGIPLCYRRRAWPLPHLPIHFVIVAPPACTLRFLRHTKEAK